MEEIKIYNTKRQIQHDPEHLTSNIQTAGTIWDQYNMWTGYYKAPKGNLVSNKRSQI